MWWNVNETPSPEFVFLCLIYLFCMLKTSICLFTTKRGQTASTTFLITFMTFELSRWRMTELENATLRHPQARLFMFCNIKKMSPVLWCHRTNIRQSSNQYREASLKLTMRVYELAIFAPVSNWFHSVSFDSSEGASG